MEYRLVGGSDLKVSALSLGTATFGGSNEFFKAWGETGVQEATELVSIALDSGVNLFDTADVYSDGLSESILGKAIAGRREKLLISSKATFRTGPGKDDVGSSRSHLIAACEASLRRLGTDCIDLWQLHGFDALTPVEETLRAMDDLVRAGKVRYIGCSNFSGWHLMKELALSEKHGLARHIAHQAHYSLLAREYEWELMPLAMDQQVGTLVWSPLSGGLLSGKVARNQSAPAGSRLAIAGSQAPELPEEQFFRVIDALQAISLELKRSVSQIALNWVLRRPSVSTLVIGARNKEQLQDNLKASDFVLSVEHIKVLDAVSDRRPIYPYWHQRETFADRNPLVV